MKKYLLALTLLAFYLTSGCQFHLRHYPPRRNIHNIYVSSTDQYSPLANRFRRELSNADFHITQNTEQAQATVHIENTKLTHTAPTIGTSNQSRVYHFTYTAYFSVSDAKNRVIIKNQAITTRAHLTLSPGQLLSTNNQLDIVTHQMERDLSLQFIYWLNSPKVARHFNENLPKPSLKTAS